MTGRGAAGGGAARWSAVLFDLDGTLADTVELIVRCYRHTMEVHLGAAPPDERWLSGIGMPLRDQLRAFARDDAECERMALTYRDHQRAIHDGMVAAYPGALETIRALRRAGTPVGIVTSKSREMARRTLDRCGFGGTWDVLVGADDVTRGKPDPEPVVRALRILGAAGEAHRALMVGDSPFDIRAGRGAGCRTAAVGWGPFARKTLEAEEPDWFVESPRDLLALAPQVASG